MGTKYSTSAQTGDEGVSFVRATATAAGAIYRTFENPDLGVDGTLELLTEAREPSGDLVLVQIKTGPSYIRGGRFYLDADRAHFETWARYAIPVVGIVCDPANRTARWVDISKKLRDRPELIAHGPYTLETPAAQPFTTAGFGQFVDQFRRPPGTATRVDTTPNLLIRKWQRGDAVPTRALLQPIALDYPGFDGWLSGKFAKAKASKKVVAVQSVIAAFSMWQRKDPRNVKLQTFMVGSIFRGTAIGQHLLYHELRTWARDPEIARVYVTVSSSKVELIEYFKTFGFRVEGFAPNRYDRTDGAAELIMAKHFVRQVVRTPRELRSVRDHLITRVWGLRSSGTNRFGVIAGDLSVPSLLPQLTVKLDSTTRTVAPRLTLTDPAGADVLRHDDASLMQEFFPLRIHLTDKRFAIVPIYKQWADAMLSTTGPAEALKLRVDNVYYCYPRLPELARGDLVLFYEPKKGGGRGVAMGAALVLEVVVAPPQRLYDRFSSLGVYKLADVKSHANANGDAVAIHFGLFEAFQNPVTLARIRAVLGKTTNVQGLTSIGRDTFEVIRSEGLAVS